MQTDSKLVAKDSTDFRFDAGVNRTSSFNPDGTINPRFGSGVSVTGNPVATVDSIPRVRVDPATGLPMLAPQTVTAANSAPLEQGTYELDRNGLGRRLEELGITNGRSQANASSPGAAVADGIVGGQGGGGGARGISGVTRTNGMAAIQDEVRQSLGQAGVTLDANKGETVYYNDRAGKLIVKGTEETQDKIRALTNSFGDLALNKELPAKVPEVAAAPMPAQREINGDVLALDEAIKREPQSIGAPGRLSGKSTAAKSKASSSSAGSSVILPPPPAESNLALDGEALSGSTAGNYKKDTVYRERLERLPSAGDMPRGATVLKEGAAGEKQYAKAPTTTSPSNVYDLRIVGYADVPLQVTNGYGWKQEGKEQDKSSAVAQTRPYFEAKHKLEDLQRFKQILEMKQATENTESLLPKTTMVEIMDDARPATNASSSLWDKLTGKPAHYESKARIKVDRDVTDITFSDSRLSGGVYDPYFIQTEFETIQSEQVLGKVVKDLQLDEKWAKNGGKISTNEAIAKLKGMLDLKPVRSTRYIDIQVKGRKAEEAAEIANSVARSYGDYRAEVRKQLTAGGIVALKEQLTEEEKKIEQQRKIVDELRLNLQVPDSVAYGDAPATLAKNDVASKVEGRASEDKPLPKPVVPLPTPQPEVLATENAFSTFSLNVSDVSFKLAAASLEKGEMPDAASIRSEEFINAFDYRDPEPPAGAPIAFAWERARYPFAQNRDLLRFSIKTAAAGAQAGRAAEPRAAARQFRLDGARGSRADHPRSVAGAGGAIAAAGQVERRHVCAHGAAARGCDSREPGGAGDRAGQRAHAGGRHESGRGDEPRVSDGAASLPRERRESRRAADRWRGESRRRGCRNRSSRRSKRIASRASRWIASASAGKGTTMICWKCSRATATAVTDSSIRRKRRRPSSRDSSPARCMWRRRT